jgi:hypothetical protein
LQWAHGETPEADPTASMEKVLRDAPADVRSTVANGLRALHDWCAEHERH